MYFWNPEVMKRKTITLSRKSLIEGFLENRLKPRFDFFIYNFEAQTNKLWRT